MFLTIRQLYRRIQLQAHRNTHNFKLIEPIKIWFFVSKNLHNLFSCPCLPIRISLKLDSKSKYNKSFFVSSPALIAFSLLLMRALREAFISLSIAFSLLLDWIGRNLHPIHVHVAKWYGFVLLLTFKIYLIEQGLTWKNVQQKQNKKLPVPWNDNCS